MRGLVSWGESSSALSSQRRASFLCCTQNASATGSTLSLGNSSNFPRSTSEPSASCSRRAPSPVRHSSWPFPFSGCPAPERREGGPDLVTWLAQCSVEGNLLGHGESVLTRVRLRPLPGYSHGFKWSDDLIRRHVCRTLKHDRRHALNSTGAANRVCPRPPGR